MTKPFDPTKPVQTRDGRPARIIATDAEGTYPIVALIVGRTGTESPHTYMLNGAWHKRSHSGAQDLINIPEKREVWVNVYPDFYSVHPTRQVADDSALKDRISRTKHTIMEGQFDE